MSSLPFDQGIQPVPIHCMVCLNTTADKTPATWQTHKGYFLCDEHKDVDPASVMPGGKVT